jgi:polyisoprenoid-binding protein YceI
MNTTTWVLDPIHTGVYFAVRHMVISRVRGEFDTYGGTIDLDESDLTRSTIDVTIDAKSIDTGSSDRDAHLRSPDFLDADNFPEIHFGSQRIDRIDDSNYRVFGELTIRGITRPVALEVEYGGRARDAWGNERIGFVASTSFDRRDFGLTWNQVLEAGGLVVGDRVDVELDVEAVRSTRTARATATPRAPAIASQP